MVKPGDKCCIARDAIEILPFSDKEGDQWLVTGVWENTLTIQRILPDNKLEELIYEITTEMIIEID